MTDGSGVEIRAQRLTLVLKGVNKKNELKIYNFQNFQLDVASVGLKEQ